MSIISREFSISDRIEYVKFRLESQDTPLSEKMDILEFLMNDAGLFEKELDPTIFLKELYRLTAIIDP